MPRIAVDDLEQNSAPEVAQPAPVEVTLPPEVPVEDKPSKPDTQTDKDIEKVSGTSVFSAFEAYPDGIFFSGEEENEEIVLLLRAHLATNVKWILATLGMIILPLIILPIVGSVGLPVGGGITLVGTLFWYMGTFTYAFINFLYWYFNVYIVTKERVIDVDWYSVLFRKVSSAQMSHIEDVSASQGGVFAGVFDYGNVHIETAAEEENFEFTSVPHPQLVAKKIQELIQGEEKEREFKSK